MSQDTHLLPNIMKAKKKELNIIPLADLGVDATPRTEITVCGASAFKRGRNYC